MNDVGKMEYNGEDYNNGNNSSNDNKGINGREYDGKVNKKI